MLPMLVSVPFLLCTTCMQSGREYASFTVACLMLAGQTLHLETGMQ